MKKMLTRVLAAVLTVLVLTGAVSANAVPTAETPTYKVAFYYYNCYHMVDENGTRTGYGYDMMQNISKYMQCTFDYVGYDKSPAECEEMLKNGELDIYTAAKITPEREAEFAISKHPAIVSTTCMNVKVGNTRVAAGNYETYNGLRVGLLERHTYNDSFLNFIKEKNIDCEIVYYDTPAALSNALINDEVDALVNSYIGIPEDERTVENFGDTPYYIMARKEDAALIDAIDDAIDRMNIETPNWRTDLYNEYYGSAGYNPELTDDEAAFLRELLNNGTVVRGVMNPDGAPFSWFDENGEAKGIAVDLFRTTAERLGLQCEIVPVETKEEYEAALEAGEADIWMDMHCLYQDEGACKYKLTSPYMSSTVSFLYRSDDRAQVKQIAVMDDDTRVRQILLSTWPDAPYSVMSSLEDCKEATLNGTVAGTLLLTYTAQRAVQDDMRNRLRADIVPEETVDLCMGVRADLDRNFYGIWEKTLYTVAQESCANITQSYLERDVRGTFMTYLYTHPTYLVLFVVFIFLAAFFVVLYVLSVRNNRKQKKIAAELAVALEDAKEANDAKQNFFSKMSHDIRTPLNVVLGMTQIAQKYKNDPTRLEKSLDNITTEGNHLLMLINSILDVNQLEHGKVELLHEPFCPAQCVKNAAEILYPLADKKEQKINVDCEGEDRVVLGDANRFTQIIINIVSNAIKYTDIGGKVDLKFECLPNDRYRFTCTDNGMGMTKEFAAHICEDYARAEDSRISKVQGTGLGMSVVKGLTDLMHGVLSIDSTLGVGSTFTVEVPFAPASEEQRREVLEPEQEEEILPRFTGKKALLAEDNALNAEIAMELLRSIGVTVDWEENGKLAYERFKNSAPGEYFAVFMDMQMPVMDGIEATKAIRASGRPDSHIPIFAMTANTFASDRNNCREAGMNGYIAKPVSVQDITGALTGSSNQL